MAYGLNKFHVVYTVPLIVTVENGEVTRVAYDPDTISGPHEVLDPSGDSIGTPEALAAMQVAQDDDWPAWEMQ